MNYALRYRFKGGSVAWTTLGRGAEPTALFKAHAKALGQMPERATREALEVEVVDVADTGTPVLSSMFYPDESLACVGDLKMDLGGPDPDLMSVLSEEQKEALRKRLKPTVVAPCASTLGGLNESSGPVDENIVAEEDGLVRSVLDEYAKDLKEALAAAVRSPSPSAAPAGGQLRAAPPPGLGLQRF